VDGVAERVSVAEAARRLGLTPDGVRKRLAKGRLVGIQQDGRQYVVLDRRQPHPPHSPAHETLGDTPSATVADSTGRLESEVAFLRSELEARRREVSELHVLLARQALPEPRADSEPGRPWWWRWVWWRR
jgi:hypothetical protein